MCQRFRRSGELYARLRLISAPFLETIAKRQFANCRGLSRFSGVFGVKPGGHLGFARFATRCQHLSILWLLLTGIVVLAGCTSTTTARLAISSNPRVSKFLPSKQGGFDSPAKQIAKTSPRGKVDTPSSSVQLISAESESYTEDSATTKRVLPLEHPDDTINPNPGNPKPLSSGVSLADLEAMAIAYNPTLIQSQAAISAEQGAYLQAGLYPNPQAGFLNNSASRSGVENSNGAYFSQEIVTAKKLKLAQNSAAVEIQRYTYDNESQRKRILNDLKIRYYEALGAQESLKIAEHALKLAADVDRIFDEKVKRGNLAPHDDAVLQSKRHLELVRLTRDEAEDRLHGAWDQMSTMIGCAPLQPSHINEDLASGIPDLDQEQCWQTLLASSPQLRSTECDLGHAVATYNETKAQAIPNVTVQVVSKYDTVTQATTVSSLVALPLPIINRNQGNIDKASADVQAARAEITRVELVLREQLNDSFRRYRRLRRMSSKFQTTILPSVEKSLEIENRLYTKGTIGIERVFMAQENYYKSQEQYVESLTDLHKAVIEIEGFQLLGGLNPAAIGSAIQNQPGGGAQRQRALLNEAHDQNSKQLLRAAQVGQ